VKKKGSIANYK